MRKILGYVLGATLIVSMPTAAAAQTQPAAAAQPDDPAKLAEAHAILDTMFPPAQRQQMFDQLLNQFSAQMRKGLGADSISDAGLKAILDDYFTRAHAQEVTLIQQHMPQMFDAMAVAYTHEFSLAELKDVRAFAETPSGRHYLSRSTAIMGDPAVAQANANLIADSKQSMSGIQTELRTKVKAYLAAHPDVEKQLNAGGK